MPETTTPLLSEAQIVDIEARLKVVYAKWHEPRLTKQLLDRDIPALIGDWKAMKAVLDDERAAHLVTVENLQETLARHDALREQLVTAREALAEISVKKYEEFAFGQCVGIAKNALRRIEESQ